MTASAKPKGVSLIRLLCVGLPIVLGATAATAQSRQLEVPIHQAARVQLGAAAGSVIVANPAIADVAVTDARTLFITGKAYGVTEVIAVDGVGRPLFQRQIVVAPSSAGTVRVWRGQETTEVTCGSTCAPAAPAGRGS
ncbi:pilus assembly protein N-terminal domain-containing protein [Brevundimonas naejangsanensis]|uniref:pilus assembly protein N-terminal domain-containing protein n=1 Tax=Brevundimonas naejangsanensis TaxID=588932 RepID=UPI000EC6648B|nr:pilus assembly protein N-terminal domain-containing protein [Brevundimonas naejangsanensis]HAC01000.1 pilus assembly protein CpaC [Brevundimonas sp.]